LNVCREFDDVTSVGKLLHVRAAATGNARSPTVDSRVAGTSNVEVEDESWRMAEERQPSRVVLVHGCCGKP